MLQTILLLTVRSEDKRSQLPREILCTRTEDGCKKISQTLILVPFLYLLYITDILKKGNTAITTFADTKVLFATNYDPKVVSQLPQYHLDSVEK